MAYTKQDYEDEIMMWELNHGKIAYFWRGKPISFNHGNKKVL